MLSLELNFNRRLSQDLSLSDNERALVEDGSSDAESPSTLSMSRRRLQGNGATIDVEYEISLRGENAEAMADAVAANIEEVAADP